MPTIEEVLDDDDFLAELKSNNDLLLKFLDRSMIVRMIKFITQEPTFYDKPSRCFSLPFVVCESLCSDISLIQKHVFEDD